MIESVCLREESDCSNEERCFSFCLHVERRELISERVDNDGWRVIHKGERDEEDKEEGVDDGEIGSSGEVDVVKWNCEGLERM